MTETDDIRKRANELLAHNSGERLELAKEVTTGKMKVK